MECGQYLICLIHKISKKGDGNGGNTWELQESINLLSVTLKSIKIWLIVFLKNANSPECSHLFNSKWKTISLQIMKGHEIPCILQVNLDENSMELEKRRFTLIGHLIWEKYSGVKKISRYIWK